MLQHDQDSTYPRFAEAYVASVTPLSGLEQFVRCTEGADYKQISWHHPNVMCWKHVWSKHVCNAVIWTSLRETVTRHWTINRVQKLHHVSLTVAVVCRKGRSQCFISVTGLNWTLSKVSICLLVDLIAERLQNGSLQHLVGGWVSEWIPSHWLVLQIQKHCGIVFALNWSWCEDHWVVSGICEWEQWRLWFHLQGFVTALVILNYV